MRQVRPECITQERWAGEADATSMGIRQVPARIPLSSEKGTTRNVGGRDRWEIFEGRKGTAKAKKGPVASRRDERRPWARAAVQEIFDCWR